MEWHNWKPLRQEKLVQTDDTLNHCLNNILRSKENKYVIIRGASIGGDAPKEVIKIYDYKRGTRRIDRINKWDRYVAKTGHKWYPYESITEFIINKLGCALNLKMAESQLLVINSQLRFVSKFFLQKGESLEHGAEIYSGYLEDKEFVEEVERNNESRNLFTMKFTKDALQYNYGVLHDRLFNDFVEMVVFDAIVGNNDRHFYNWGVITDVRNREKPYFAPIYDSARALFWNRPDSKLKHYLTDKVPLHNYARKSKPKTGLELRSNVNHIDVVRELSKNQICDTRSICEKFINQKKLKECLQCFDSDFGHLISKTRRVILKEYLTIRFDHLFQALR